MGRAAVRAIPVKKQLDLVEQLLRYDGVVLTTERFVTELLETVDRTIEQLEGKTNMDIKEYYQGFSDEQLASIDEVANSRMGDSIHVVVDDLMDQHPQVAAKGQLTGK